MPLRRPAVPHPGGVTPLGHRVIPGHRIEIEIEQANGARARVVGTIDRIPVAAGGEALQLVITNAVISALPAKA